MLIIFACNLNVFFFVFLSFGSDDFLVFVVGILVFFNANVYKGILFFRGIKLRIL